MIVILAFGADGGNCLIGKVILVFGLIKISLSSPFVGKSIEFIGWKFCLLRWFAVEESHLRGTAAFGLRKDALCAYWRKIGYRCSW